MRIQAALAAQTGAAEQRHHATGYELMLAKLDQDRRRLKDIQSIERKISVKRELLPEYEPWVEGVLAGDAGVQDDVLMTVMLWRIDTADFTGALSISRYAIAHQLVMPDRFERTTACLIAEEFADTTLNAEATTQASYWAELYACEKLTADQDMPDRVRAKLFKACAYSLIATLAESSENEDVGSARHLALEYLKRALQLHDRCGVKKDIERLEREIKNSVEASKGQG
jgi:hypothetical protein